MTPPLLISRRLVAATPLLLLGGCSAVGIVNALAPDRLVAQSVPYANGPRRSLDVYAPARTATHGHPVVMFIYGGSWDAGRKRMYRFVGGALASLGFVVVIPDYRLYPEVLYPAFLRDCAAAFHWTRRNAQYFGGSSDKPFLMGHSAGAYNAAMLTLDPRWLDPFGMTPLGDVRGMVGLAGPYDFLPLDTEKLRAIFAPGKPLISTQPIDHVSGHNPPLLLLAGKDDHVVRPSNTIRLAAAVRAKGGVAFERLYSGIGHVELIGAFSGPLHFLAPSLRDSAAFMHAPSTALARL